MWNPVLLPGSRSVRNLWRLPLQPSSDDGWLQFPRIVTEDSCNTNRVPVTKGRNVLWFLTTQDPSIQKCRCAECRVSPLLPADGHGRRDVLLTALVRHGSNAHG
eukprot:3914755-Rhodomonas_salina.1